VLWFTGLAWFVPARWRTPYAWTWAVALALLSTFALTQTLAAAYPRPTFVAESALPNETLSDPVRFGDELALGGVELPSVLRAGELFHVVLYWQSLKPELPSDYTVTLQLFAADGKRIAQLDTFPVRGMYPTSAWQSQQWLRDDYPVALAPDASAGAATLIVGLYDRVTNKALQITLPDGRRVGRWTLGQLELR
ncbi:MAG: hypothetical protein LC737_04555, partial [Chloroflexi bacterium]|nr:hypothetical protein [Chloroflexota bacterium]